MNKRIATPLLMGAFSLLALLALQNTPAQQPAPAPTYYVLADVGGTLMYVYPPTQPVLTPTFPNAATVSPTPIVSAASPTPTRTPIVTPTMVTPALPTVTDTPPPATDCTSGVLPCWTEGYRAYEVVSQVWLCIYDTNPCGSDPERRLRLLAVGEKRYVWCVYEFAPGNLWASEFRCDAAFDRSWNAILYGGKRYMVEIENDD